MSYQSLIAEYGEKCKTISLPEKLWSLSVLFKAFGNTRIAPPKGFEQDIIDLINPNKQSGLNFHIEKRIQWYSSYLKFTTAKQETQPITDVDEAIANLKPEDFKEMEYDWEFLATLGIDKPGSEKNE